MSILVINTRQLIWIQQARLYFRRNTGGGPPMTRRLSWLVAIPGVFMFFYIRPDSFASSSPRSKIFTAEFVSL